VVEEHRAAFGARLKAKRQQKGISLEIIAAASKISVSLFASLERGDLSRWPKGLFRRSYFREYLRAVGLPTEPTLSEFLRLFPDEDRPAVAEPRGESVEPPLALTLATSGDEGATRAARRLRAAAIDALIILIVSCAAAWSMQKALGATAAIIAVAYYSMATISGGLTVGSRWMRDRSPLRWKRESMLPRAAGLGAPLTDGVVLRPWAWVIRIPVAWIAGHAFVDDAVRPREDVA
jgi:transcriptional regulator with XRE-family HTH domain